MPRTRLTWLAVAIAVILVWPLVPVAPVAAKDAPKGGAAPAASTVLAGMSIGGQPMTITISPDLSCAVNYDGDTYGEFYGDTACGTLIAVNGVLYGPASIPAGGSASPRTAFTPASQTVSGSGTPQDPRRITTVVDAGTSGLRLTEVDSYIDGRTPTH